MWNGSAARRFPVWRADLHAIGESCVRFGRLLRSRGIPVTAEQVVRWRKALHLLRCDHPGDLYWSARVTLVTRPEHLAVFDELFRRFWLTLDHAALDPASAPWAQPDPAAAPDRPEGPGPRPEKDEPAPETAPLPAAPAPPQAGGGRTPPGGSSTGGLPGRRTRPTLRRPVRGSRPRGDTALRRSSAPATSRSWRPLTGPPCGRSWPIRPRRPPASGPAAGRRTGSAAGSTCAAPWPGRPGPAGNRSAWRTGTGGAAGAGGSSSATSPAPWGRTCGMRCWCSRPW